MAKIIAGSNTLKLAEKVSGITGLPLINKTLKKFPDGETYVKLEGADFKGEDVFIIHSLYPDVNENLVELLLTADAVNEHEGTVHLVIPYIAYARQDKVFESGEAFSLKTLAKIFRSVGTQNILFVDSHFHRKTGDFVFFGVPARNISAAGLLSEYAQKSIGGDLTVVGPDEGSKNFLKDIEGVITLKKNKRFIESNGKEMRYETSTEVPEGLENKNVLILDDMISSGETMKSSAIALKARKNTVYIACTHGLFTKDSLQKLGEHCNRVICTDTVESRASIVSVSGLIADEIRKISCG